MENNNGKGIFYGVIGVATLIVAIIGATFAYFSATTVSKEYVQGAAATASLGVHVDRLTTYSAGEGVSDESKAKFAMIPQLDAGISAAIRGADGTPCIDANGSLVCSIYKITVQNTGSVAVDVSAFLDFYGTSTVTTTGGTTTITEVNQDTSDNDVEVGNNLMNHLKWARLEAPEGLYTTPSSDTANDAGSFTAIDKIKTIPDTMLDYTANGGQYQQVTGGYRTYANHTDPNMYLYAMDVTVPSVSADFTSTERNTWVDLLGTDKTEVWSHDAYRDLIDPTADLVSTVDDATGEVSFVANEDKEKNGIWHLEAYNNNGDTAVFYIVVWISENEQKQNAVDFGQFTGQITFESTGGSGTTSTFTEAYNGGNN